MPLPSVRTLHSRLLPLLIVLCWLYPISAEAKPDATEEHSASVDELQTKAGQGFVKQEMELAADYSVGRGVPQDLSRSAYWYRKAADQGNPAAELFLGYMYTVGIGVSQDRAEAVKWYRRAASSDDSTAKVNLAALYMRGEGVKQDTAEGVRLLKSAAEKGDGRADAYLGLASYLGSGVPVDFAAAESWFKQGVKRHDPEAECFLANVRRQCTRPHARFCCGSQAPAALREQRLRAGHSSAGPASRQPSRPAARPARSNQPSVVSRGSRIVAILRDPRYLVA